MTDLQPGLFESLEDSPKSPTGADFRLRHVCHYLPFAVFDPASREWLHCDQGLQYIHTIWWPLGFPKLENASEECFTVPHLGRSFTSRQACFQALRSAVEQITGITPGLGAISSPIWPGDKRIIFGM